jgi:hypothetical protein
MCLLRIGCEISCRIRGRAERKEKKILKNNEKRLWKGRRRAATSKLAEIAGEKNEEKNA